MRRLSFAIAIAACAFASPALAQFPPPGIYPCTDATGHALGTLSLLVAGDYQWQAADGSSSTGQVASAATDIEALTGPLADAHWHGSFATDAGRTSFVFETDAGKVTCALP